MDRKTALAELQSPLAAKRLAAARTLARDAGAEDVATLEAALSRERVRWVRNALMTGLARIRGIEAAPVSWPPLDDPYDSEQVTVVTLQVTARLLHELEPLVGTLRLSLQEEWADFETSEAERHVTAIEQFLEVMSDLHTASKMPKWEEVDLRDFARELVSEVDDDHSAEIAVGGPSLVVRSDSRLLALALRNGLRNAVEAVRSLSAQERRIVITWGRSAGAFFVAILDNGPGLHSTVDEAMTPGTTTKPAHNGVGLSLAQQVAASLSGALTLSNRDEGGVRFELQCPEAGSA